MAEVQGVTSKKEVKMHCSVSKRVQSRFKSESDGLGGTMLERDGSAAKYDIDHTHFKSSNNSKQQNHSQKRETVCGDCQVFLFSHKYLERCGRQAAGRPEIGSSPSFMGGLETEHLHHSLHQTGAASPGWSCWRTTSEHRWRRKSEVCLLLLMKTKPLTLAFLSSL